MAIGDSYATLADLQKRLGRVDDGTFTPLLSAASRAVEAFTGRQFNRTEVASARRFRASDWHRVAVDDFHTITDLAVTVDGVAWLTASVDPRPWNGVVNGQIGWPFFDLIAIDRHWPHARHATITVTARWGWPTVPEGVKQATLDVAVAMASASTGTVRSESVAGYSVTFDVATLGDLPDANVPSELRKVAMYRRKQFGVA